MLAAGTILNGRYEIAGPLAAGGMGEVYRARRRMLGDDVAIKVIRSSTDDAPELRDYFFRESRAAAQLRHPGIVSILDFDVDAQGRPFLVMELLSGPSLRELLRDEGPLSLSAVQRLATELGSALQLAHDRGFVHRDLKPANIVRHRFETGEVVHKIIDFGLAQMRGGTGETRATGALGFAGTLGYASPEQLRGIEVDHRSDIYSFGTIVFEMLTGEPLFPEADLAVLLTRQLTSPPRRASSIASGLPRWLDAILLRALDKDPQKRWPRVTDFAQALCRTGDTVVVTAPPTPAPLGTVGQYALEQLVGRGRLGSEVYAARHRLLEIPVAVRIVRRESAPNWDAVRARFVQEARALQVAHPSVLQVRDFGEEDGVMYLVTDLIAGPSLREVLARESPLPWPRLDRLLRQLLDAVRALHRHGGGICGMSPQIIRTTRDDAGERVVISSAGICQVQDVLGTLDEQTLRGAGSLDPELPYIAPEVFLGRPPTPRSDVFTLGVLMYEMATGRLPFQAGNMLQLIGAAMSMRPHDPRDLQPEIPAAFAEVTLQCLLADPDARPAGPEEILAVLGPPPAES